jgi:hypothetical protein
MARTAVFGMVGAEAAQRGRAHGVRAVGEAGTREVEGRQRDRQRLVELGDAEVLQRRLRHHVHGHGGVERRAVGDAGSGDDDLLEIVGGAGAFLGQGSLRHGDLRQRSGHEQGNGFVAHIQLLRKHGGQKLSAGYPVLALELNRKDTGWTCRLGIGLCRKATSRLSPPARPPARPAAKKAARPPSGKILPKR